MRRFVALAAVLWSFGCGTAARLSTRRGDVEGSVTGGTAEAIFVHGETADVVLPRGEVLDIDHPGKVAMVVGGILVAYGAFNIATKYEGCSQNGSYYCAGVFTPASVGVPLLLFGVLAWMHSYRMSEIPVPPKPESAPFILSAPPLPFPAVRSPYADEPEDPI